MVSRAESPSKSLRITFVIPTLAGGGAERIVTIIAGGLAGRGHRVTLLTTNSEVADFYSVPDGVYRVKADPGAYASCRWFDFRGNSLKTETVKQAILETAPDMVVAFMSKTGIGVLKAMAGTGIPVLVSEHSDSRYRKMNWRWNFLRRYWYPKASRILMLTAELADWGGCRWPRWKVSSIPNPVVLPEISDNVARPEWFGPKNLVAMGRLIDIKGFDLLLEAFATLADRFSDWNLAVLGEGEGRKSLEELVRRLGLSKRVFLPGTVNPPFGVLAQADLFVLSSRCEGFPMALAEAMACGVPSISFNCPSGPSQIIRDGEDGILVPPEDTEALAQAMARLMGDGKLRSRLAAKAPEVTERFGLQSVLNDWEKVISETDRKRI